MPSVPHAESAAQVAEVARSHGLDVVVLFGSRARGQAQPGSDTDLAVLPRRPLGPQAFLRLAVDLGQATGLPQVDLVDLTRSTPLLQCQVARHGRPLFEADQGLFNLFQVKAWKLYLDDRRMLRHLDADYIRGALERLEA